MIYTLCAYVHQCTYVVFVPMSISLSKWSFSFSWKIELKLVVWKFSRTHKQLNHETSVCVSVRYEKKSEPFSWFLLFFSRGLSSWYFVIKCSQCDIDHNLLSVKVIDIHQVNLLFIKKVCRIFSRENDSDYKNSRKCKV